MSETAKIVALLGWSAEFFQEERWKNVLEMSSPEDFINGFMKAYFEPMDPNALLLQMNKWGSADVSQHSDGDLGQALGRIKAKSCVMPISHDLFFPPSEAKQDNDLIPNSLFRVIESKDGHFALNGVEPSYMEQVDKYLAELLRA